MLMIPAPVLRRMTPQLASTALDAAQYRVVLSRIVGEADADFRSAVLPIEFWTVAESPMPPPPDAAGRALHLRCSMICRSRVPL